MDRNQNRCSTRFRFYLKAYFPSLLNFINLLFDTAKHLKLIVGSAMRNSTCFSFVALIILIFCAATTIYLYEETSFHIFSKRRFKWIQYHNFSRFIPKDSHLTNLSNEDTFINLEIDAEVDEKDESNDQVNILYWNTPWNGPFLERDETGCKTTMSRENLSQADAVVFHFTNIGPSEVLWKHVRYCKDFLTPLNYD